MATNSSVLRALALFCFASLLPACYCIRVNPKQIGALREIASHLLNSSNQPIWEVSESKNCSQYIGLTCNRNGYITHISLEGTLSSGKLSPAIGKIYSLVKLDLGSNNIDGPIPAELSGCRRLVELILYENNFSGGIPAVIGRFGALKTLILYGNNFTGPIPTFLGRLRRLESLYLGYNSLRGSIPNQLGTLVNLVHLNLVENKLGGSLPSSIGSLANLQSLELARNEFTGGIPATYGNLKKLDTLDLSGNFLTFAIPPRVGAISTLKTIILSGNFFTGVISSAFDKTSVTDLELASNCLTYPSGWKKSIEAQRSASACSDFCGTTSSTGPCSGHGTCYYTPVGYTCLCNAGFTLSNNTCRA